MPEENPKLYKLTVSDPASGSKLTRTVMAPSLAMAEGMIPSGDNDIVTIVEAGEIEQFLALKMHPRQPNLKDQRLFFSSMARALGLNPDLIRSLELTIPSIQNHYFRMAIAQMIDDLQGQGEDVQTAVMRLEGILSNDKIAMLQAGAQSGELDKTFKSIAINVDKQSGVMKKVVSALTYPAIVLIMGMAAVLVLSATLFKQMKGMFMAFGADLPLITKIFMGLSDFLTAYWWAVIPVLFGVPALIARYKNDIYRSKVFQDLIDKPAYLRRLHWKVNMSRCLGGLSLLLASNVPIQKSLELTAAITEHIKIKTFFDEIEKGILKGMTVDEAVQRNAVYLGEESLSFLSQIRLGTQTGNLEEVVRKMAEVYEEEVDEQVGMLSQFVEPIILAFLGLFVGAVVISMYLPMVTLYQSVL